MEIMYCLSYSFAFLITAFHCKIAYASTFENELQDGLLALKNNFAVWEKKNKNRLGMPCTETCFIQNLIMNSMSGSFQLQRRVIPNCETAELLQISKNCYANGREKLLTRVHDTQVLFKTGLMMTWHEALKACRKSQLRLGSLDTPMKAMKINAFLMQMIANNTTTLPTFWTSGIVHGNAHNAYWVDSGQKFNLKLNATNNISCLYQNIDPQAEITKLPDLKISACSVRRYFFCEIDPRCLLDICSNKENTTAAPSLRITSSTTRKISVDPNDFGNGAASIVMCNQQHYFISKMKFSANRSQNTCFKLGMKPAVLTKAEDLACLYQQTQSWIISERIVFWTAEYEVPCARKSCSTRYSPEPLWLVGEPEKWFRGSSCVAMFLSNNLQGAFLLECNSPLRFICQMETNTLAPEAIASLTNLKKAGQFKIPPYNAAFRSLAKTVVASCEKYYCKNDEKANITEDGSLTVQPDEGTVKIGCGKEFGKQYLFTKKRRASFASYSGCCNYGFQTATVTSSEELTCVLELFKELRIRSNTFWGPFLDVHMNRSFDSCVRENATILPEILFPGELNNLDGREPCMMYVLTPGGVGGLADTGCTDVDLFNFCEAPFPFVSTPTTGRFAKLNLAKKTTPPKLQ